MEGMAKNRNGVAGSLARGTVAIVAAWTLAWSGVPALALAQVADSPRPEEGAALEEKREDDAASATPVVGESPASELMTDVEEGDGLAISTQASGDNIASGKWGTCDWEIDSEGTLRVHAGEGSDVGLYTPWGSNSKSIKSAVLEDGVKLPQQCAGMFAGMSMTSLDASGCDTSNVKDMSNMFQGCESLTSLNISGWDTSAVTSMAYMFSYCTSLTSLDISGWDTLAVTNMGRMFWGCSTLSSLDVSHWDTSKVTSMDGMFFGCRSLTALDLSNWNTSSVTNMHNIFDSCSSLSSLNLSGWKTPLVTGMVYAFRGCSSLKSLDLSGWDTSSVKKMEGMFAECSSLSTLKLGKGFKFVGRNTGLRNDVVWRSSADGKVYTAIEVPSNVAATYTAEPISKATMYRLYNPYSGEHFYTASAYERDSLSSIGWNYEGEGWKAPERSNSPVYRLYNPYGGDHHYTTSTVERDYLKAVGWNYEGVGWYSDDAKGVPLYRQYNPYATSGSHNYTASKVENDMLVSVGWNAEGIGWYGMK